MEITRRDLVQAAAGILAASSAGTDPAPWPQWDAMPRQGPGPKGAALLRDGSILCARTTGGPSGPRVECLASRDAGMTWETVGEIVARPHGHDVGDGCLLQGRDDRIYYSYRDNSSQGETARYAIRVEASDDRGANWRPHSTVESCQGARGGLWSSFLTDVEGRLQCYYDDERTPWDAGFPRHQWLSARTYDSRRAAWSRPITVSRAHDPAHLSRDGMGSVVRLKGGRLLCAVETVDVRAPYSGVIMAVHSDDGGRSWSWRDEERCLIYQPGDRRYGAYEPWLALAGGNRVVCVFGLNEGRETPAKPGARLPDLQMDIACTMSVDGGRTWTRPGIVYAGSHRNGLPGVLWLPRGKGRLLCHWLDFDRGFLVSRTDP